MAAWLDCLRSLDRSLFHQINQVWTNRLFDAVLPVVTDLHKVAAVRWVLVPAGLAFWLHRRRAEAARVLLGLVVVVGLTDTFSHRLVKPFFHRARPEKAGLSVVLRTHSHYGYSFPSIHAANMAAGAAFLGGIYPALAPAFYAAAALIAYSRVYNGVHYPLDAAGGALLGFLIGWLGLAAWRRRETARKAHAVHTATGPKGRSRV